MPVVSEGYGHFIGVNEDKIIFDTYDLFDYRAQVKQNISSSQNRIPKDFILKSTYDLVQSIFYSLKKEDPYHWIICEGVSEKIYFEYFFKEEIQHKNLRILPMGGQPQVIRLYKYLETPMSEEACSGKVFCLIDTDVQRCAEINNGNSTLRIIRLSNKNNNVKTDLLTLSHSDTCHTDIEQSLDPSFFMNTIDNLVDIEKFKISNIENMFGNSNFIKNIKNLDIEDYFKENLGNNKILFAKEYIRLMEEATDSHEHIPSWINEIKSFINS